MRRSLLLIALSFTACSSPTPPRRDWAAVIAAGHPVPADCTPLAAVRELAADFGSPDPVARDEHAYGILAQWLHRQRLLTPAELGTLVDEWLPGLQDGLGSAGDDRVLRRSFTALGLSLLAARDLSTPFLDDARRARLVAAASDYLTREVDLRDHDPQRGWIHATAHTADLLKFLARSPATTVDQLQAMLRAIAARTTTPMPRAFSMGEDERLARAVLAIARRADAAPLAAPFLATLHERAQASRAEPFAPERFDVEQNALHLLRALHALAGADPAVNPAFATAVADTLAHW